jgi:hypothetical protein
MIHACRPIISRRCWARSLDNLLNQPACIGNRLGSLKLPRNLLAPCSHIGGFQQLIKKFGYGRGLELLGRQRSANAKAHDTHGIVGLVVAHGHDQLRDTGRQCLSRRADAAVVDERRRTRQELAEWDVRAVPDAIRQCHGELIWIARHEQAAASK